MNPSTTAGWYGKVSMLGDFASRRLAPAWVQTCDRWLSEGMECSRRRLGDGWRAAYLTAPLWRFALAPGVVDSQWWFGILMPSSDSVGRYFPLVVAHPRPTPPTERFALDHLELWWRHVADAALGTLAADAQLQAFEDDLQQTPPWPVARPAPNVRVVPAAARERVEVDGVASLDEFMHGLAALSLLQRLAGCSLWWPQATADSPMACTVAQGLPAPEAFADLLTGQW